MILFVLGNPDEDTDNAAVKAAVALANKVPDMTFRFVPLNQDLPFEDKNQVILMDTVDGIIQPTVFTDEAIDHLLLSPRNSTHDYDANIQLKYLKKLGKLGKITIVGVPRNKPVDYKRIQSILRKLVAQDMHGS